MAEETDSRGYGQDYWFEEQVFLLWDAAEHETTDAPRAPPGCSRCGSG